MNKILNKFLSMGSAIVLLLLFAIACASATIIENNYDTTTAWASVYGAFWFEILQLLLGINLCYNIYRYKLISFKKFSILTFHVGFIVILLGAGITRYFGFEGSLHIRNGETTSEIWTNATYLQFLANDGKEIYKDSAEKRISQKNISDNDFSLNLDIGGKKASFNFVKFVPSADFAFTQGENGKPIIELAITNNKNPSNLVLDINTSAVISDVEFCFNKEPLREKFVKFSLENDQWSFTSSEAISYFIMSQNEKGKYEKNSTNKFEQMVLYGVDNVNFSAKFMSKSAVMKLIKAEFGEDALVGELEFEGKKIEAPIFINGKVWTTTINGVEFLTRFGALKKDLSFDVRLNKFKLDRYPGSMSPMSYASDVTLFNKDGSKIMDFLIYMNNVLDYGGYRFYQSSYDMDEQGSILSVNNDPGKIPTYVGYLLLGIGFFLNIITPNSRFRNLAKMINEQAVKKLVLVFALAFSFGADLKAADMPSIDKNHAKNLSMMLVQSMDGRIKPFDSVGHEVLNKIYRKSSFNGLTPSEVMLSMMLNSHYWQDIPIIKISNNELKKILGIDASSNYAKFSDFFVTDEDGKMIYKLIKTVQLTNRKNPALRGQFDKDVIKVDERVNIMYMVFMGELFRMFPKIDDPNHTWYSPTTAIMSFNRDEANEVSSMLQTYFKDIIDAQNSGNWAKADESLNVIKNYQLKYGSNVIPEKKRIEVEILLNKYNIFNSISPFYLIAGFVLLISVFFKILRPKINMVPIYFIVFVVNLLCFLALSIGLGMRWFASGHAPWSNAYESLIYVSWAMSLAGLIFAKKSPVTIALTSILSGITLFVAHLSWLDPQITTLVPVLNSYWLTIHVSVITASYGFLALCAFLGLFVLILMCFHSNKENPQISRNILEATRINEMSMILGIFLLTLGNFLGGVWANESWGRYWGWDSKETWSLISIVIYTVVLHLRFVPKFNNQYIFALTSAFAYWAIIMTYFGVNFYLSGMHSYAAGDPVPVPNFVGIIAICMMVLSLLALRGYKFIKKL